MAVLFSFVVLHFAGLILSAPLESDKRCPDYANFSKTPQGMNSTGPLALPYMRPDPDCRTFKSRVVEKVIDEMTDRMKDPDLARLFENTFPNTLDTTVKYYDPAENLAFIITGDITAQWLRDTANQFAAYYPLLAYDKDLAQLVKAVINNEARYIARFPYCGAFQPPPESGLRSSHNGHADGIKVTPWVDSDVVFECKERHFEIDSLCGFLKLSRSYYQRTKDGSIFDDDWTAAMDQILKVVDEQSQSSLDMDGNFVSPYSFFGEAGMKNRGHGELKKANGLVGTTHRPSDDKVVFPFITPANAMLSVELGHLADVAEEAKLPGNLSETARDRSLKIRDAVMTHTISDGIFAYETNGFGGKIIMDDANVPSLLSLPYLGFVRKDDPTYLATRKAILSDKNPYYLAGETFAGIGGPHVSPTSPWPMSQISAIFGTDDDEEILASLKMLLESTNGLGLIHESVDLDQSSREPYSRSWFAWANSYFAEMMLDLAQRKPGLIFQENVPFVPGPVPRLP